MNFAFQLIIGNKLFCKRYQFLFNLQIDEDMFKKVLGYIDAGKNEGARCLAGGEKIGNKGYFIKPTVFADVKDDMKIAKEEVSIFIFTNENYVVR